MTFGRGRSGFSRLRTRTYARHQARISVQRSKDVGDRLFRTSKKQLKFAPAGAFLDRSGILDGLFVRLIIQMGIRSEEAVRLRYMNVTDKRHRGRTAREGNHVPLSP